MDSISVIIPVYNGESFIQQAILSVDTQGFPPLELIVINDGSTDATEKKITDLRKRLKTPFVYIRTSRRGQSAARNEGIKVSKGMLLSFLDADDTWRNDKLEKQIAVFQQSKFARLGCVYCNYSFIDDHESLINQAGKIGDNKGRFVIDTTVRGEIFSRQLKQNLVAGSASAVLIKRECFDRVGLFDESLLAYEDADMWLRIARRYAFDYTPETLVFLRRHTDNMTHKTYFILHEKLKFYSKWKDEKMLTNDTFQHWYELLLNEFQICIQQEKIQLQREDWDRFFHIIFRNPLVFFHCGGRFLWRMLRANLVLRRS